MQRERELLPRFAAHYVKLKALPRRVRRSLQRQWKQTLAGVALMMALGASPAVAATIPIAFGLTVPDINNDFRCSLIEAIVNANNDAATHPDCVAGSGADTIQLPINTTQTLTAVYTNFFGPTGLPLITSDITLIGNGSKIERSSAAATPDFRIFAVNRGSLTLQETTVSGGLTLGNREPGGGIYNYYGALTVTNSTISGNSTGASVDNIFYGNASYGGGLFNFRGTLTVTDSTISGNSTLGISSFGGGVHNREGTLTLTNSTVSGNSTSGPGTSGGGVSSYDGPVKVTDSTISGNSASGPGGGVRNRGGLFNRGTLTVTNSTISGNSTSGIVSLGGGVINTDGLTTVANSTISNNSTSGNDADGGGVSNIRGTLRVTNSTLSGNFTSGANSSGGGVYNHVAGALTLTNSTLSGNSTSNNDTGGGGGLLNRGTATVTDSTIFGNSVPRIGGGVFNYGTLTLSRTLISGNTSLQNQGMEVGSYSPISINGFNLFGHSGLVNTGLALFNVTPGPTDIIATPICPTGPNCVPTALTAILDTILANNGGPTRTHALVAGSPAIDAVAGTCPPPDFDQRGVTRPQPAGGNCDIGSFEIMAAPSPDLAVDKTDSPDPVVVSDHLTYTIDVNNAGEAGATGVTLTDTLPSSVTFVSVTPSAGCGEAGGVVECELGDLASGDHATVTIVVQPTTTGVITNSAAVTSVETDHNLDNNTDSEDTTVNELLCNGLVPTIVGTPGPDTITGTSRVDVIHGLGGNDIIQGRGGNDVICGGEGADTLRGNDGRDQLFGENGDDTLKGNAGRDALDGGGDIDTCEGGSGADTGVNCETQTSIP
jgi:uncharacterized repeat protein (TIGR01451 family)